MYFKFSFFIRYDQQFSAKAHVVLSLKNEASSEPRLRGCAALFMTICVQNVFKFTVQCEGSNITVGVYAHFKLKYACWALGAVLDTLKNGN